MNFIIDTKGESDLENKNQLIDSDDDDIELEDIGLDPTLLGDLNEKPKNKIRKRKVNSNDFDLEEFERDMGWKKTRKNPQMDKCVKKFKNSIVPVKKFLKESVITPDFESLKQVPSYDMSDKKLKKIRKREREKDKGKSWFNLPATEMTDEIKNDLEIIQMRSVLDPKHFYKKNDMKVLPKYFQIGKVLDSPLDYYNSRLTKKERKRTIVDELMADAEFSKYNKRKYKEIIDQKNKLQYKARRHAKKLKRRGKNK